MSEQTKTSAGKVVKVGAGRLAADGSAMPMPVAVGESVKFRDYAGAGAALPRGAAPSLHTQPAQAGSEVKLEGVDYVVCRASDCLAKWTE